jgi:hypothetical protein
LLLRDVATGTLILKLPVRESRWQLPAELDEHAYTWRVQWRTGADDEWREGYPELPLATPEPAPAASVTWLEWHDTGAYGYRVLVRDDTDDVLLRKDPVLEPRYAVVWDTLPPGHRLRWRLQEWNFEAATWHDVIDYVPLRPEAPRYHELERGERRGAGIALFFTVDTEVNLRYAKDPDPRRAVEEQIFARVGGREVGIGMIMDLLERHGFRATFFLDVLAEYQIGRGALDPVVDAIRSRGHDIQLHLHTAPHLRFSDDPAVAGLAEALHSYDPDQFRRALELAVAAFVEVVGSPPLAYRSGGYHLCDGYLPVLTEFGIRVDSSLYAFKNCHVSEWIRTRTQPFRVDGLLEIPVSWGIEWRADGPVALQFAPRRQGGDDQASFTQLAVPAAGAPVALVYLSHSYQYLVRGPAIGDEEREQWYATVARRALRPEHDRLFRLQTPRWYFDGPDESRIQLLEQNLSELASRGDVVSMTMADAATRYFHLWDERPLAVDPVPEVTGAGAPHVTATRVYSLDLLRTLA